MKEKRILKECTYKTINYIRGIDEKMSNGLISTGQSFICDILIPECDRLCRDSHVAYEIWNRAYDEHKAFHGSFRDKQPYFDLMNERLEYQMSRVYDYLYFNEE